MRERRMPYPYPPDHDKLQNGHKKEKADSIRKTFSSYPHGEDDDATLFINPSYNKIWKGRKKDIDDDPDVTEGTGGRQMYQLFIARDPHIYNMHAMQWNTTFM